MKLFQNKSPNQLYYYLAVSTLFIVSIFYFQSQKNIALNNLLTNSEQIIIKNNDILFNLINIETGFRGLILTNNESFLEPFITSKEKIILNINQLKILSNENIRQKQYINLLNKKVIKKIETITKNIVNFRNKKLKSNEIEELFKRGKIQTNEIKKLIDKIKNIELVLLKNRELEIKIVNSSSDLMLFLFLILFVVNSTVVIKNIKIQKNKNNELTVLTDSQKLYSKYTLSLIEASLDPLVTINTEGKITDMNEATVRITGIERNKLIGSDFFNYFTEQQKAREVYQEVFKKGSVADSPLTLLHKDGNLTNVLFNGSVYKDDNGNVLGVVIVARDIAEQKWALNLRTANKELAYQNDEKEKRAAELVIANKELEFQNNEKEKRANELFIANQELAFQNNEKEKRAGELSIANKELAYQNKEKEKRAAELVIANEELEYQNNEKEKRANELSIANDELAYQNNEKEKRANELLIANEELEYQNTVKEKRAAELIIANEELAFQKEEKEKRVAELVIANYARSLIEASLDPLVTISADGKITDVNEASIKATGIAREKLIDTDFSNYFTEPKKAQEGYQQVFKKGFVADYPLTIKHINGNLTDVLYNASVYKDNRGNVLGVFAAARDIAEQKRIENELIEAKIAAEKATAIAEDAQIKAENATLIAKEAVKSKQQFLSNMSHEIRTPMNAIIGFTKVILKTGLTAKQKEYLTAIKISGDALIVIINDILDLAKVDSGKMVFEQIPFKLKLSISLMLHLFETKIHEKNLELILEFDKSIPEILAGDPVRLNQIILNLVGNAIKFTSVGQITVGINLLKEDESNVFLQFSVKDTGIGISSEKIEGLFENFQQASSATSRIFGGTGLGLAIVKQLVEPQGGTLNVESTVGVGSTFSFILPFKKTDETITFDSEILEANTELKDTKVLVVEDLELNQLLVKTLLDDFGFESEIVANGKLAIERLKTRNFDIILMDLQMPEMNGFEATKYIREKLKLTIPIIALTADVTTIDADRCIEFGMNDYISKPIDEGKLFRKMTGLIGKPGEKTNLTASEVTSKSIDLTYLRERTKSNPKLMSEMISIYLKQTPQLIYAMNEGLKETDWDILQASAHKMIPSFSIMGISAEYEIIAKKIQECATNKENYNGLSLLIQQLEIGCKTACLELEQELKNINS